MFFFCFFFFFVLFCMFFFCKNTHTHTHTHTGFFLCLRLLFVILRSLTLVSVINSCNITNISDIQGGGGSCKNMSLWFPTWYLTVSFFCRKQVAVLNRFYCHTQSKDLFATTFWFFCFDACLHYDFVILDHDDFGFVFFVVEKWELRICPTSNSWAKCCFFHHSYF